MTTTAHTKSGRDGARPSKSLIPVGAALRCDHHQQALSPHLSFRRSCAAATEKSYPSLRCNRRPAPETILVKASASVLYILHES